MVYHSSLADQAAAMMCSCPILPLRESIRGPAPNLDPPTTDGAVQEDIVDEVLRLFRANVLFKSFEVHNAADRLLVYLTLYTSLCLNSASHTTSTPTTLHHWSHVELAENKPDRSGADRALSKLAHEGCALPGEPGFPLGGLMTPPENAHETGWDAAIAYYLGQNHEQLACMFLVTVVRREDCCEDNIYLLAHATCAPQTHVAHRIFQGLLEAAARGAGHKARGTLLCR